LVEQFLDLLALRETQRREELFHRYRCGFEMVPERLGRKDSNLR
jgi:hypothetical protein